MDDDFVHKEHKDELTWVTTLAAELNTCELLKCVSEFRIKANRVSGFENHSRFNKRCYIIEILSLGTTWVFRSSVQEQEYVKNNILGVGEIVQRIKASATNMTIWV